MSKDKKYLLKFIAPDGTERTGNVCLDAVQAYTAQTKIQADMPDHIIKVIER